MNERALELLRSSERFVLTTHMAADGDGIGSQLALARGLKLLGRSVSIVNPTPVPENLAFLLASADEIVVLDRVERPEVLFEGALSVVLDMGALDRLAGVLPWAQRSGGMVVVDHHPMEIEEGIHYLLDTAACATGEVTARLLDLLGVPLTREIAEPLYVAVHTDTGGFRYPGTTSDTHRLVARFLDAGVDPQGIYTEIYERMNLRRLRLTGAILSTLAVTPGGRVAHMELTRKMLAETGAEIEDGDDLVNFTLYLDGVVAGFYFKEIGPAKTKVSCRSRGDFAINRFVAAWGGGGHFHAAGLRLDLPLKSAEKLVLDEARRILEGSA